MNGSTKDRKGPEYLKHPVGGNPEPPSGWVAEPPPRARRPGTTPTTDAIATIAVGAALGVMVWMSPEGAWWPYLVAPVGMFLGVWGVLNLLVNRPK